MTALQIVKANTAAPEALAARRSLDLLVDGLNLTARLPDVDQPALLRDLSAAVVDLAASHAPRITVGCHGAGGPWELGLERTAGDALVSLYRGGPLPEVAVFERRIDLRALAAAVIAAMDSLPSGDGPEKAWLDGARCELSRLDVV